MQKMGDRALPKFGDWDVKNPASSEGFTVIFEKARGERNTPPPPPPTSTTRNSSMANTPRRNQGGSNDEQKVRSSCSRWLCW